MLKLFNLHNTNILLKTNSCEVCWQWLKWLGTAENKRIQVSFEDPLLRISALFSPAEVPRTITVTGIQQQLHPGDQQLLAGRKWHCVLVMIIMIALRVTMQGFVLVLSFSDCTFDLLTWHNKSLVTWEGWKVRGADRLCSNGSTGFLRR